MPFSTMDGNSPLSPLLFTLRSNSNGFCRCFACRIGKIPLPLRYLTEFSVLKIPTMNCNLSHCILASHGSAAKLRGQRFY